MLVSLICKILAFNSKSGWYSKVTMMSNTEMNYIVAFVPKNDSGKIPKISKEEIQKLVKSTKTRMNVSCKSGSESNGLTMTMTDMKSKNRML